MLLVSHKCSLARILHRILECKDGGYVPFQLASAKFFTYSLPLSSSALGSQSRFSTTGGSYWSDAATFASKTEQAGATCFWCEAYSALVFRTKILWKAKLQCPGVGSAGPTQVSRTQMSLRPVRCFLPGSRSVLPWRHNHSNRSNLNWTQPKHHEHHKSMQKCLKQSVSPFGLCAFATCCTHRRLWIFLPPQWLWANQEKSHSKKEPMFIKRGWATFCRPKTWKNVGPESYLRMGPWRLSKNITASTARSQLEMEATASKYM